MATIIIVTGNPLLDHLADIDLVPGHINRTPRLQAVAGGKGLNVGRVLVRHGHRVLACGFAGGASGEQFRKLVSHEGQEPHFTATASSLRMGFLARDCAGAGSTGLLENGFAISPEECDRCIRTVVDLLPQADLLICSGSVADPQANRLYAQLSGAAADADVPCWVDSYGPPADAALSADHPPALCKPNRQEYDGELAWDRAAELHISDGPGLLHIHTPHGRWQVQPPSVISVNPIGSGDSYVAALAHARLSDWPIHQQLSYAAAAGALNASQMSVAELEPVAIERLAPHSLVSPLDSRSKGH